MSFQAMTWAAEVKTGSPMNKLVLVFLSLQTGMDEDVVVSPNKLANILECTSSDIKLSLSQLYDARLVDVEQVRDLLSVEEILRVTLRVEYKEYEQPKLFGFSDNVTDINSIPAKKKKCTNALRDECKDVFAMTCEYCDGIGGVRFGPDGNKWHVDRINPGAKGGVYEPNNVTLSCQSCNCSKRDRDWSDKAPRSLADVRFGQIKKKRYFHE